MVVTDMMIWTALTTAAVVYFQYQLTKKGKSEDDMRARLNSLEKDNIDMKARYITEDKVRDIVTKSIEPVLKEVSQMRRELSKFYADSRKP